MRYAIPFLVVCAALVASVLVLGAFARPPEVGPLPDLTLRDLGAASDSRTGVEETEPQRPANEKKLPPDHGLPVKSVLSYDM